MAILNTRKTIRRAVGRITGDMLLCTATGNGTTTTFSDTLNLNRENKIFQGRQGIVSGGTSANLGRIVRVSDLVKATQTITFTPALPSATAISDEIELWNQRDEGVTPGFVNEAINDLILNVDDDVILPVTSDSFTFSYDSATISVDDLEVDGVADGENWEGITGVDWQDWLDDWHPIPRADIRVDRVARTVEILGRARYIADAYAMRVRGANSANTLSSDSSTTSVPFEWIVNATAAVVLAKRMETSFERKELEGRYVQMQARADATKPKPRRLRGAYWRLD